MTNRRVHITSFNDLGKACFKCLIQFDSFCFRHIINSLEQFILFKSRTVTEIEHSPKGLSILFSHSPIQIPVIPNHEYLHFKTFTNRINQTRCRKCKL